MLKGAWQPSGNGESEALPQSHGAAIRSDHEIELHGGEFARSRLRQRMGAHGSRHPATERVGRYNVTAIGDMGAPSTIVGSQVVCADNDACILGHKHGMSGRMPVGERIGPRNVARNRISFSGAKSGLQDSPDAVIVARFGLPDQHETDQPVPDLTMTRSIWPLNVRNFPAEIGTARPSLSSSNGSNPAVRSRSIMP